LHEKYQLSSFDIVGAIKENENRLSLIKF